MNGTNGGCWYSSQSSDYDLQEIVSLPQLRRLFRYANKERLGVRLTCALSNVLHYLRLEMLDLIQTANQVLRGVFFTSKRGAGARPP